LDFFERTNDHYAMVRVYNNIFRRWLSGHLIVDVGRQIAK
jgi:hypothetical protein